MVEMSEGWREWVRALLDARKLGSMAKAIGLYLAVPMFQNGGEASESVEQIARDLSLTEGTVIKYINRLVGAGLIEKRRRFGQANVYAARLPGRD